MLEKIFEENLNKFSKISPKTAIILPNIEISAMEFSLTNQGELNLKRNNIPLHDQNGAIQEADTFLTPLLKENVEAIYIYGVGLGYSYFVAKEWLKKSPKRQIIFLEDDLIVLRAFLSTERASDLLSNPQARLIPILPDFNVEGGEVLIESCLKNFHITALPYYLQNRIEEFQKVVQTVLTRLFMFSNRIRETLYQESLAANFYRKLAKISDAKSVNGLLETFADIPCMIIGAGPSLEKDLEALKNLEDKAILFGSGSAVNALNEHGIYPHFGAGLDPTIVQASRVKTNAAFETPFFYTNRFSYEALDIIHGPKIFTPQNPEKLWCKWFEEQLEMNVCHAFSTGFSTSNYCTSIALFLGCNPIIFLGMDMAYGEGKKYLPGVKSYPGDSQEVLASLKKKHPDAISVTNFEGKTFETTVSFVHESGWFTVQAKSHPEKTFIYSSEEGFGINKVPRKVLKEIPLKRQYDLLNQVYSAIELAPHQSKKKDVMAAFQKWKRSLSDSLLLLKKMLKICTDRKKENLKVAYSPEWVLLETELEGECAYEYLLKNVQLASNLLNIHDIIQFRFNENPTDDEIARFQMQMLEKSYEIMIRVGKQHLKALKQAMHYPSKVVVQSKIEEPKFEGEYSFENGILKIFEPSLNINIAESFNPVLIPKTLKETPEWRNHEPVREVYVCQNKVMEGECIQYFPNGVPKARQYYLNGQLHGPSTFFTQDGKVLAKSWFYKGKREGVTVRYFADGKLNALERWKNGVRQGNQEYFYANGSKKSLLVFDKGILQGNVELFYANGNLKFFSSFKNGKKVGREEFFYFNGTRTSQVEYENNLPVGTAFFWHANGQMAKEIEFNKNGDFYLSEWDHEGKELTHRKFSHSHNLIEEAEALKQSILDLMNDKPETIL